MPNQYTTPNYNQDRLNQLKNMFPDLFTTEGHLDKTELAKLAVLNDPDKISISDRYSFAWSGKTLAKQHAFAPSLATLTHDKERSYTQNSPSQNKTPSLDAQNSPSPEGVAPQGDGVVPTTQNLFQKNKDSKPHIIIEGENLEVLKQLQGAYYEQIKCIYIDPPYNTGKDFVYSDNFTQDRRAYWQESGQTDEYGVKITTNTESSGRYHSDWLSMIYSRLLLARQLLTDDGVIFVSIDDNEVHNLRKVMDEVFGEENFVGEFIKQSKVGGGSDTKFIVKEHEYVLVFSKNIELSKEFFVDHETDYLKRYKEADENGRFFWDTFARPGLKNPINYDIVAPDKSIINGDWIRSKERFEVDYKNGINRIIKKQDGTWSVQFKQYLNLDGKKPRSMTMDFGGTIEGKNAVVELFGSDKIFSYPKSPKFVKTLLSLICDLNSLILDFFAGSGTTGQAVMELNQADGGNRQCILVQMPELTDERSEAYKAGYKRISDITIERNKRVIQGYGKKNPVNGKLGLNTGFEVFRLEQSNFPVNQWRPDPELGDDQNVAEFEKYVSAKEASLFSDLDPTKAILEIAIKEGLKLDYTQKNLKEFENNKIFELTDNSRTILVCIDSEIKIETVELLAKDYNQSKFVCLERALDTTSKWNLNHNLGAGFKAI